MLTSDWLKGRPGSQDRTEVLSVDPRLAALQAVWAEPCGSRVAEAGSGVGGGDSCWKGAWPQQDPQGIICFSTFLFAPHDFFTTDIFFAV